jgi:predicted RNA-binding Zn ribbon-like protein
MVERERWSPVLICTIWLAQHNQCAMVNRLANLREVPTVLAKSKLLLFGGRLAIDFTNCPTFSGSPNWEGFIRFLEATHVVSPERGAHLLSLPQSDPQAADNLLSRAARLQEALRKIFGAVVRKEKVVREWVEPVNEILRITEGHDELVWNNGGWRLEFFARESGLEWLLAAIARSAAEILVEGPGARLRLCANPSCGLFFSDMSRTRRRRWCSMALCGNRHKVAAFAHRHSPRRREA